MSLADRSFDSDGNCVCVCVCVWVKRVEGLDAHLPNGKLQYKIFAAGITGATGLTLPETPISGSNTTPTSFPLSSDAVSYFHVFIYSLYEQCCCVSLLVP